MRFVKRGLLVAVLSVTALGATAAAASAWSASGNLTLSAGIGSTCAISVTGTTSSFDTSTGTGSGAITSFASTSCSSLFNLGAQSVEGTNENWDVALDGAADTATITKSGGNVKVRAYVGAAGGYCGWEATSLNLGWNHTAGTNGGSIVFTNEVLTRDTSQDTGSCGVVGNATVNGSLAASGL